MLSSAVPEGRGLIAEQAIRRGEALLQVPQRLLLTPDAALRDSSIGALLDRAGLPAWSVLAALLAELKLGQTSSRDRWGPYADALPAQTGCVLEWSADEVSSCQGPFSARRPDAKIPLLHEGIELISSMIICKARRAKNRPFTEAAAI